MIRYIIIYYFTYHMSCSNIPESSLCPISHNIMTNPYIDNDGNTYEYSYIMEWLDRGNNTSPITRLPLLKTNLTPNRSLLDTIKIYLSNISIDPNPNPISNNLKISEKNIPSFKLENNILDFSINKYTDNNYTYFNLNICPIEGTKKPPIDIIVIIDISGSMDSIAYIQQNGNKVDIGYTILDITKHAIFTIIESINQNDRISIITFSDTAETILPLTNINKNNKTYIKTLIKNLTTKGATNIWAGINAGLEQFIQNNTNINRISSMLFLTDGIPSNHLLPPRGIINTLIN